MQQTGESLDSASPERSVDYDCVVVGTSPICFLTALLEKSKGKRVLMVDAAPEPGGTWRTVSLLGFSNVEIGCHYIDADRDTYRLLDELGIRLQPLDPQPFLCSLGPGLFPKRLGIRHRWMRDLYDLVTGTENADLPGSGSRRPRAFVRALIRIGRHALVAQRGTNYPAKYPPTGSSAIIARLEELALSTGVGIRTSTRIDEIVLDRLAGRLRFRLNGQPMEASQLYITSSTDIKLIVDAAGEIDLNAADTVWQSLYLALRDCGDLPFSYVIFSQGKRLHRASDLTRFAVPGPGREGVRLIACAIDERAPENENTALEVLATLKQLRLVNPSARLEAFDYLPYHFVRIDPAARKHLKRKLNPLVRLIESDSLTGSIKTMLREEDVRVLLQRVKGLQSVLSSGV